MKILRREYDSISLERQAGKKEKLANLTPDRLGLSPVRLLRETDLDNGEHGGTTKRAPLCSAHIASRLNAYIPRTHPEQLANISRLHPPLG